MKLPSLLCPSRVSTGLLLARPLARTTKSRNLQYRTGCYFRIHGLIFRYSAPVKSNAVTAPAGNFRLAGHCIHAIYRRAPGASRAGRFCPALARLLHGSVRDHTSGFLFRIKMGRLLSQTRQLRRGSHPVLKKLERPKADFPAFGVPAMTTARGWMIWLSVWNAQSR